MTPNHCPACDCYAPVRDGRLRCLCEELHLVGVGNDLMADYVRRRRAEFGLETKPAK